MKLSRSLCMGVVVLLSAAGCAPSQPEPAQSAWTLEASTQDLVSDPELQGRVFQALDAAATAGTDPSISHFNVRVATVIPTAGEDRTILGGNAEYARYPEAIHGETSLMSHVINTVGPEAAYRDVDFIAFNVETCSGTGPCGDCRDYLMTTTRWEDLVVVCGQASDHTVHAHRFADWVAPESEFPEVTADGIDLTPNQLERLVVAAVEARAGGVSLFTAPRDHLGVAALTTTGEIYRAAGTDDAAFHYRYPVGAALQQAATFRDYFVQAIVIVGEPGEIPRLSYRDRQYGYEFSSFNAKRGLPPIQVILVEEPGPEAPSSEAPGRRYRLTTFEDALPAAFSATNFMPEAVDEFLAERARP